jgi:hypothetical protein
MGVIGYEYNGDGNFDKTKKGNLNLKNNSF